MEPSKGETLTELQEDEADEEVRAIYAELRRALRVSFVPQLFRALAVHQSSFPHLWRPLKPTITHQLERAADALRSTAVSQVRDAPAAGDHRARLRELGYSELEILEIQEQLLVHHYVAPKLLIVSLMLAEALKGRSAQAASQVLWPLGRGIPPGMPRVTPVDPGEVGEKVARIFAEIQDTLEIPAVGDEFRTLARWPDVLELAWSELMRFAQGGAYSSLLEELCRQARERAQALPRRLLDLEPERLGRMGIDARELSALSETVERGSCLAGVQLINAAHWAVALVGPEEAALPGEALLKRWSVPRPHP